VKVMEGERIVFTEESAPQRYIKLVASGDVDESLLDAIEDYVKRQKKRLQREARNDEAATEAACSRLQIKRPRWRPLGLGTEGAKRGQVSVPGDFKIGKAKRDLPQLLSHSAIVRSGVWSAPLRPDRSGLVI